MTREEEIAKRLEAIEGVIRHVGLFERDADLEFCDHAPDDLRYLLEKVERLEIEVYKCHIDHDNTWPCECEVCERVRRKEPARD